MANEAAMKRQSCAELGFYNYREIIARIAQLIVATTVAVTGLSCAERAVHSVHSVHSPGSPASATRVSPPPRTEGITGIDHVSFVVSRLDAARRFYVDLLGLTETAAPHAGQDGRARAAFQIGHQVIEIEEGGVTVDGHLGHVAFATGGGAPARFTDPDGHGIELVPGPSGAAPDAPFHLAHVGVLAGSLSASLRFYGGLGFREFWRGGSDPRRLDWVNVRVPAGNDYVELMLYDQLPPPDARGGKNHVCIFVADVVAAAATIEARPARQSYPRTIEVKVGRNRKRQVNLFDPDGTRVEFMEPVTIDGKAAPPSPASPPRP
jgi:lactoylglutathione lyase